MFFEYDNVHTFIRFGTFEIDYDLTKYLGLFLQLIGKCICNTCNYELVNVNTSKITNKSSMFIMYFYLHC